MSYWKRAILSREVRTRVVRCVIHGDESLQDESAQSEGNKSKLVLSPALTGGCISRSFQFNRQLINICAGDVWASGPELKCAVTLQIMSH